MPLRWPMLSWNYMNLSEIDFRQTFFVLDFDRCLGDTDKAHDILWSVIETETGITVEELRTTKANVEQRGLTFDTLHYLASELRRQKHSKTWQDVRAVYVAAAKQAGILMPDASELLDVLDERQIPYGVLTYGKEAWQLTKLEASGLVARGVPFEITQIEHKGRVLSSWQHGDELVVPPAMTRNFGPLSVQSLVFLDDKPRSFIGLPGNVCGICVRPSYPLRLTQQGPLPDRIYEVQGINGALQLLFGKA